MIQAAHVFDQRLDLVLAPQIGGALERPEPHMAVRQPHQNGRPRRRRLVPALQRLAGLDQRKGATGRDALRLQHRRRQHLAHPALQRQPPIAAPRPGRLAGALRSQIHQPTRGVAHLRRQEPSPVAQIGIVVPELMPVIAHGDRTGLPRQGLEPPERGDPFRLAQPLQPDLGRRAVVAKPQDRFRKVRGLNRIGIVRAQVKKTRFGAVGWGDGHGRLGACPRRGAQPRARLSFVIPQFRSARRTITTGWARHPIRLRSV